MPVRSQQGRKAGWQSLLGCPGQTGSQGSSVQAGIEGRRGMFSAAFPGVAAYVMRPSLWLPFSVSQVS